MPQRDTYRYDAFVSCGEADEDWVEAELLPRLEAAGLRVAAGFRDLPLGTPRVESAEWAILNSHRTIVVLSPGWLASHWAAFEGMLVRALDPAARRRRLLPVLLHPCEVPPGIRSLETLDLTTRRGWDRKMRRLIWSIWAEIPEAPPWRSDQPASLALWQRWLRRHRRPLRAFLAAVLGLWLVLSLALQWPPFQPRPAWISLGLRAPQALSLARAGQALLVGGANPEAGCDRLDMGLWRSTDAGQIWQPVSAPALCFDRPGQGQVLADVIDLASAEAQPGRAYAATSDVGLLRTDDAGQTWSPTGRDGLGSPQLSHLAVDPIDPDLVYVATVGGGLYRSADAGAHWQRLDRRPAAGVTCPKGAVLDGTLLVGALLAVPDPAAPARLVAGTGDPAVLTDLHVPGGLYASNDGGDCWVSLTGPPAAGQAPASPTSPASNAGNAGNTSQASDAKRYEFKALAYWSGSTGRSLLVLVRDWWVEPGSAPDVLLRLDLASDPPARQFLWRQDHAVRAIAAVDGPVPAWYAATDLGQIFRGSLNTLSPPEKLPTLTRCLIACDPDLLPVAPGEPPLLLAGGRVYRLSQGAWWRRLWP